MTYFKLNKIKSIFTVTLLVQFISVLIYRHFYKVEANLNERLKETQNDFLDNHKIMKNVYLNISNNNSSYKYVLNPEYKLCNCSRNITLLAMVTISTSKFRTRNIIRKTWSNQSLVTNMRVVFLLGISLNSTINDLIKQESSLYSDIVQQSFLDTYRNLTLKTLMGLKWASIYCSNSKFIMKVDDNVFVNSIKLIDYLNRLLDTNIPISNSFFCKSWFNSTVRRDNKSKFYVSREDYIENIYPTCK